MCWLYVFAPKLSQICNIDIYSHFGNLSVLKKQVQIQYLSLYLVPTYVQASIISFFLLLLLPLAIY